MEFRVFGDLSNGCQARQGLRAMAERQAAQSRRRGGPQRLDESTPPGSGARQLKSEKKFKAVFEAAVDGIVVADAQTRTLLFANEAFCKALGYGKEQIQSLTLDDIHPRDSLRDVHLQFQGQANGEFSLVHNIAVKRKDGSVFYADINSSPAMPFFCQQDFMTIQISNVHRPVLTVVVHKRVNSAAHLFDSDTKHENSCLS